MGTMLPGICAAIQRKPGPPKPTVNQAQSAGLRTATSARPGSKGPSERGDLGEA